MIKIIAENKKVYRDYEILEEIEAGIELLGGEVKSIKNGAISLKDSFVKFEGGEAFILNLYIAPYKYSGSIPYDPERKRKLLLKKAEIKRLIGKVKERGLTIVPLKVYLKRKWIKVLIGLVRGRKKYEKRQIIKEREIKREIERELKKGYG
ncbi:MAG: SsrA-binding protein SmpB [candidate division WOR-3 bacterium]